MSYYENNGQGILPFPQTVCDTCPYGVTARCEGPTTVESLLDQPEWIGCLQRGKQAVYYENLHRRSSVSFTGPQTPVALPPFIPVVTEGLPEPLSLSAGLLLGVSLGTLVDGNGRFVDDSGAHLYWFSVKWSFRPRK